MSSIPASIDLYPTDRFAPGWRSLRSQMPSPGSDLRQDPKFDQESLRRLLSSLPISLQTELEAQLKLIDPRQNPDYDPTSLTYQKILRNAWGQARRGVDGLLRDLTLPVRAKFWLGGYQPPLAQRRMAWQALSNYSVEYGARQAKFSRLAWPYRSQRFAATGLPLYQRCWIEHPPTNADEARKDALNSIMANDRLAKAMFAQTYDKALFETAPDKVDIVALYQPLDDDNAATQRLRRARTLGKAAAPALITPQQPSYHVRHQQMHQNLPVYGAQITVHTAQDDHRASLTCTYLPVPAGLDLGVPQPENIAEDNALAEMKRWADDLQLPQSPAWAAQAHPYYGSTLVILPFRGDFRLAYEIWLTSPDDAMTWSLFIDAVRGEPLGLPRNLTCHARAYGSSAEAAAGRIPSISQNLTANPCTDFMDLAQRQANGQHTPINWPIADTTGPRFDASNVAIHGDRLRAHFIQLGADAGRLHDAARRLTAVVNLPGPDLEMGFNPATRLITFQSQQGANGLRVTLPDGAVKPVFEPAHDPELVYHEVTHGLMWQLNPEPYANQPEVPPFARSLLEGYANYFARAEGVGQVLTPPEPWAAAAYRAADWQDRWTLDHQASKVGEDLMAAPWLFPQPRISGLAVYDAGMVWARTLWDVRQLLGGDLSARIDQMALEAYVHAVGTVTSFEAVAEGFIEAAARRTDTYLSDALRPLFASRGLVAEPRIQALAQVGTDWLVGTADGVNRLAANGVWTAEADEVGHPLPGVTDLLADGATIYAATAAGVYRRKTNQNGSVSWEEAGELPNRARPLALAARNGKIFAATTHGLWMADTANPLLAWVEANPSAASPSTPYSDLALDVDVGLDAAGQEVYYVAGLTALQVRRPATDTGWLNVELQHEWTDFVLCVAAHEKEVFVGTGTVGLWQCELDAGDNITQSQVAAPGQFDHGAILSLAVIAGPPLRLCVGATTGVFVGDKTNGGWAWQKLPGDLPAQAALTALAKTNGGLRAGSVLHGLWEHNGAAFSPQDTQQPVALADIPRVQPTQPAVITIPLPPMPVPPDACVLPFYLLTRSTVQIELTSPSSQPLVLWSLELNVRQQSTTPANGNTRVASNRPLAPGYYGVLVRGAGAFTATMTALP